MILVSSHIDRCIQDFKLAYDKGVHKGLLDNWLGILVSYMALYDDKNLAWLETHGQIKFFHGQAEEWALDYDLPKLGKNDIALVVDVCSGSQYKNFDFSLENISGFSDKEIKDLKESLMWEGMKVRTAKYTGDPDDEDEAFQWHKKGIKTMSFIIPIHCIDDGWHRTQQDGIVTYDSVKTAVHGLKRTIVYLL